MLINIYFLLKKTTNLTNFFEVKNITAKKNYIYKVNHNLIT